MKSFYSLIILVLTFVWLTPGVGVSEMADRQYYNLGLIAMKNGNFREALKEFTKATEINGDECKYYNDRGVAYKRLGELDKALADYNKSLEINPHYTNALNNRGVVYLEKGRYDQALADFQEALKYGGLEGKIFTNIGIAKAAKGDHKAAVQDFDSAVSLHPVDPRSFLFMGQSLEHLGDRDKALKMYQVALGVIKEPEIIALVEKKIASLDQNPTRVLPRTLQREPIADQKEKSHKTIATPPAKPIREIIHANRRPDYIEQSPSKNDQKPVQLNLPEPLEAMNKQIRDRMILNLGQASAEILRQASDFVDKSDDYKAMVRFEDIRALERRNKNYRAVGWAFLEIGRIYVRRGDYPKAEDSIISAVKIFSSLKLTDERILTIIELARLKKLENAQDKSRALFIQAEELASSMGKSDLSQSIRDLSSGSFEKKKNAPQLVDASAKPHSVKITENKVSEISKAPSEPQSKIDLPKTDGAKKTEQTQRINFGNAKSVFDMKTEMIAKQNNSKTPSSAPTFSIANKQDSTSNSKAKTTQRTSDAKSGVETLSASIHPDAVKPLSNSTAKQPATERKVSKRDLSKAISEDVSEIRKLRKQNDEIKMILVLDRLAGNYIETGDYERGLNAVNIALAFREKLGVKDGKAESLQLRGLINDKLGKTVEALEDFTWAQQLAKKSDLSLQPKIKYLVEKLGLNMDSALKDYKTLWLSREAADTQGEIKALLDLGKIYAKVENIQEASKYYELSNASLMAERALFYQKLGKPDEAKKTMEQALQKLKSLDYLLYFSFMNRSKYHDKLSAIQ